MGSPLSSARAVVLLASLAVASTLNSQYRFNPLHHLTGISPYFESLDPPASPDAPQGCTAERAAYLIRHGSIYANDFDFETYMEPFVQKLSNKTGTVDWSKVPDLNFLAGWEAPVSEAEASLLTRVGKLQATQLGVDLFFRYPHLKVPPKIYASSAERTFRSAASIVRGFELDDNTINVVSIYESEQSGADGLTPYKGCPAYSSSAGSDESSAFQERFTDPIKARLNSVAPGFNFTTEDIFGMMHFCGYETVIRGRSRFCDLDLFTPDDWLAWEYSEDEGFHAGESDPTAFRKAIERAQIAPVALARAIRSLRQYGVNEGRHVAMSSLYPKLLYNMADVFVHVINAASARSLEEDIASMLQWAQSSQKAAVNRANLPHLIIVLNRSTKGGDWDPAGKNSEGLPRIEQSYGQ